MKDTSRHSAQAEVIVLEDQAAVSQAAAQRLTDELSAAIAERGEAHLALTGGSAAVSLYEELAHSGREAVDWSRVHLWWGDERFVPVDHPESNIGMSYAILLAISERWGTSGTGGQTADVNAGDVPGLPIRTENIHPFQIDEALSESEAIHLVAERYVEEIRRLVPADRGGLPRFDVILLGVGPDAHIMSAFPGSAALDANAPLVLAIPAPEHIGPHLPRVTLNPRLVEAAGRVIVIVAGDKKAEAVRRALASDEDPVDAPARLAARPNAVWFLDRQAAARLEG
ncbi:MAG TPA: 6-phosphogluconolactonase [Candidatus Limnocylindrales bacterium]|nr:6-phosphogluconolactonase [Candidatus Limnocylindrales bacterium]